MPSPERVLLFHGALTLLVGLACGAPMGSAIVRGHSDRKVAAWRVAHNGLVLGGVTLLAVGAVLPQLTAPEIVVWTVVSGFVVSAYGFLLALPYGAHIGSRGLSPSDGSVTYTGNLIGACGSLLGGTALLIAVAIDGK